MADEPDAHVEPVEGPEAQLCAKCGKLKHPRLFRRILTQAQAEARGYFNHHIRPMTVPSKFCTECQPGRLRPSDLRHVPLKRLMEETVNNRVRKTLIEVELLRRARKQPVSAQELGRRGAAARWEKFHADRWRYAKEQIAQELRRITHQTCYYQRKLDDPSTEYFGEHYRAVVAFNAACSVALRELRAQATGFILRCTISEDGLTWRDWMGATTHSALERLWDAIPEPPEDVLRAAFGKRTSRPTFRSRLPLPRVLDKSDRRFVLHGCPVQTRQVKDWEAQQDEAERARRVERVAAVNKAARNRGDDDAAGF